MRRLLLCLMFVSLGASADDLSEANRLLAAREYGKALPLYATAAKAGNAEAQFRLGEMYWYGDGTAQDLQAANEWMAKAAAAGNQDARESLPILERRKTRGADIDYWMSAYRGEELRSGKFACPAPAFPAVSKTNAEIAATEARFTSWQACYNGFVENFSNAMPVGKVIPQEVLDMMSPAEFERVQAHIDPLYRQIMSDAQAQAAATLAQRDAWEKSTRNFVTEANQRRKQAEIETARVTEDMRYRLPGSTDNRALSGR
ncbi:MULTISPECIES: tetratricopeptide repeat protein [unclassified Massilia]|uniref:tetratricopeptide repeat protein n=1 Tax=unclassified Massilia TaxID=2609279 RepID=UPI001782A793|nr:MULTISPECIES: SEL1-like repeat protein [unclassified Massilia]MBD8530281.1 sel1 repeat family protein [Massilia sp. CFBP 13647]MBD8673058.1 sel1 repeat family protein [Massilia sp. CFBP 13721]